MFRGQWGAANARVVFVGPDAIAPQDSRAFAAPHCPRNMVYRVYIAVTFVKDTSARKLSIPRRIVEFR